MVPSLALDLFHAARSYEAALGARLTGALAAEGVTISDAQLGFLAALICGDNTASDIARRLGISRQAVARQVGDLEQAGWLTTTQDQVRRNQRIIRFTDHGERLMGACRRHLKAMDQELGPDAAKAIAVLGRIG